MMQCRYDWLGWLMAGYEKTDGQPLIGYKEGLLVPFNGADDIGMYYIIPKIAHFFSLSLDQSIAVFFNSLALLACSLALVGLFLLYRASLPRVIAVIGIIWLARGCLRIHDVYAAYAVAVLAVAPLWLYGTQQICMPRWFVSWSVMVGVVCGFLHYIRTFAGMPVIVFALILLGASLFARVHKIQVAVAFLLGYVLTCFYFSTVYSQYVLYAVEHCPGFVVALKNHVFWHQLYIGLGFLQNPFGIAYNDAVGFAKARSINPDVVSCSAEYEALLRHEVIALVLHHPMFILKTIFAKCGVIFLYFLRFAHGAIVAALVYRKPWQYELAFAGALASSALFALLTDPDYSYLLGFIAFCGIYAVVSINYALQAGCTVSLQQRWRLFHDRRIQRAYRYFDKIWFNKS